MSHLNHQGPDENGLESGRGLGLCSKQDEISDSEFELGKGKGLRRKSQNSNGIGRGKRLRYSPIINNNFDEKNCCTNNPESGN